MKYLKLSLLAILIMGVTTSCFKMEEKEIFDENAATRLDNAIKNYNDILTREGGKWMLEYYANANEVGYVYLLTFDKNGSVKISGKNNLIGEVKGLELTSAFGSEVSQWEVIGDNGPVLTFNTYNKYFHIFANPEDIATTETDEQGYGHEGDYEFDIMKYSGDTLYIDGKKYENHMIMTRIKDVDDDEAFFTQLDELKASIFSLVIPELYLTAASGKRFVCSNASTMMWNIYPEGGDAITETLSYNAIFTPSGVRFMNPLGILANYNEPAAQAFKIKDGKLVSEDGLTTIEAAPLSQLFNDQRFKWQIDAAASSGAMLEAYNAFAAGVKEFNGATLQYINFYKTLVNNEYVNSMLFNIKMKTGSSKLNCNLYNTVDVTSATGITIKFTGEGDKNALTYKDRVPAIAAFLQMLENTTLELATDRPLGPNVMRITEKNNPNSYLTIKIV